MLNKKWSSLPLKLSPQSCHVHYHCYIEPILHFVQQQETGMSLRTLKYQRTTNTPKTYRRSVSYFDIKPCSEFIFILFIVFNTIFRWFTLVWCSFTWTKLCKWRPTKCWVSRKSKWVENLELIAWMNLPIQIVVGQIIIVFS